MKTASTAIFIGVLVSGLLSGRPSLYAQPTSTSPPVTSPPTTHPLSTNSPIAVEGDDKPWNRGVPVTTRQAARDLFLEGNRLFNIPLFTRAAEKYIAALEKWKHPAFYFNLALTQLNLGQDVEAHDNLERAMKHGAQPLGVEQYKEAQKQLQEVERQLGRIRIICPTDGAEVTLDGAMLFTGPGNYEKWVQATPHEITAKKSSYATQAKQIKVSPGTLETLDLQLHKIFEERPWATWKPWALVGTGILITSAGGAFGLFSAKKIRDYDSKFSNLSCASRGCQESDIRTSLKAELNRAMLEQKIAIGSYITGGAVIATGVVLVYLNRPHLVERGATNSPVTRITVAPSMSTNMLGMSMTVSY